MLTVPTCKSISAYKKRDQKIRTTKLSIRDYAWKRGFSEHRSAEVLDIGEDNSTGSSSRQETTEYGSTPSIAKNLAINGRELLVAIVVCCHRGKIQERVNSTGPMNKRRQNTVYANQKNVRVICPIFDRGRSVNSSALLTVSMITISLSYFRI
ncbi:hypothetical protein NPIL_425031 [Nephila pilipes]|uniref:Uncharacterized protein n=1 Tax=Nephila pilipes TaxID=299642 RepID=A0A8X6T3T9_NEPPI|nr:hypothetical protein NPIL_425031 [Nephila pilipes]